jgi:NADH-quinone oxidoreductase subunit M
MLLFAFSSIGLPGLNGFAGEFLVLAGMFQRAWVEAPAIWTVQWLSIAILATLGVVLGAWYMLWLIERVFFGRLRETAGHAHEPIVKDMSGRELLALAPLAVFVIWIGVQPQFFLRPMAPALDRIAEPASVAFADHYGAPVARQLADRKLPAGGLTRVD